ncbi:MFS transporter, partial [Enterobacter hormaechei]|nr:MFS transporter [Enterobacter hormaechei]
KEAIVISMLLTWLLSAGVVVVILLTPAYLQTEFGLAKAVVSVANMTAILALCAGCLVAGYLCDKLGASVVFTVGSRLLAVCPGYFYRAAGEPGTPLSLTYGLAGFSVGVVGA